MPSVDVVVESDIERSFRVEQIASMFDVAFEDKTRHRWRVDLDIEREPAWQIGVIVGPSGSGKTTIARAAFGDAFHTGFDWHPSRAVIDGFPEGLPTKAITLALSSVGFSSPPSWVKPYHVLSNGEKFRVELARLLLDDRPLVVVDEWTSVVDRTVAQVGSAAVAKAVRRGKKQLVALSCHYDILEWLEPDWVYDLRDQELSWARLQRPRIDLAVERRPAREWHMFAPHHYLSAAALPSAHCYIATHKDEPVACVMVLAAIGRKNMWREARCVVMPDYQGLGIGGRLSDAVASLYRARGCRYRASAAHPALIAYWRKSPLWRIVGMARGGRHQHHGLRRARSAVSYGRSIVTVEYVGDGEAEHIHATRERTVSLGQGVAQKRSTRKPIAAGVLVIEDARIDHKNRVYTDTEAQRRPDDSAPSVRRSTPRPDGGALRTRQDRVSPTALEPKHGGSRGRPSGGVKPEAGKVRKKRKAAKVG